MTNSEQAIREFAEKWGFSQYKTDEGFLIDIDRTKQCLSDLTALISEHYVAKEEVDKMVSEKCKKCKYRGLPDSINEALNSGDGVYRP